MAGKDMDARADGVETPEAKLTVMRQHKTEFSAYSQEDVDRIFLGAIGPSSIRGRQYPVGADGGASRPGGSLS